VEYLTRTRIKRRDSILSIAFEQFLESGINSTTMEDIAIKAQVTRQTMYRYYQSKDELALSVELWVLDAIFSRLRYLFSAADGLGTGGLLKILDTVIPNFIEEYADDLTYTGIFDFYYRNYPEPSFQTRITEIIKKYPNPFTEIIRKSANEEKIKELNITVELIGETLSNSLLSLSQRALLRRKALKEEYGFDPVIMIPIQMKLMISSLIPHQ
jgi:AcrR family transcriptional regulator